MTNLAGKVLLVPGSVEVGFEMLEYILKYIECMRLGFIFIFDVMVY